MKQYLWIMSSLFLHAIEYNILNKLNYKNTRKWEKQENTVAVWT